MAHNGTTVRQRIMPYFPQATIVKSTTVRNRAAAHVPLQSIVQNAISMARVIGKPPPSGVAIVVIAVDATSLWKASSTRADVWVNVWGGAKYASKVKLWASWFCMDGGDEQAFLRSLDISANLNQEVRDVEEDVPFMNRPFESEMHGTVNFTNFCFVLLVTWRHRLRFLCHLRQNVVFGIVLKFDV